MAGIPTEALTNYIDSSEFLALKNRPWPMADGHGRSKWLLKEIDFLLNLNIQLCIINVKQIHFYSINSNKQLLT
jgi:hypothetical protein